MGYVFFLFFFLTDDFSGWHTSSGVTRLFPLTGKVVWFCGATEASFNVSHRGKKLVCYPKFWLHFCRKRLWTWKKAGSNWNSELMLYWMINESIVASISFVCFCFKYLFCGHLQTCQELQIVLSFLCLFWAFFFLIASGESEKKRGGGGEYNHKCSLAGSWSMDRATLLYLP